MLIYFEQYNTPFSSILNYLYQTYSPKAKENAEEKRKMAEEMKKLQETFEELEKSLRTSLPEIQETSPITAKLFNPLYLVKEVIPDEKKREVIVRFADGSESIARGPKNEPFSLSNGFAVALLKNMLTAETLTDDLIRAKVNVIENNNKEE